MELSKGQKSSIYVGVVFLVLPYSLYFYALAVGLLPSESEWWAQGMNHGPWRWKWQMAFILPSFYIFMLGSFGLLFTGIIKAIRHKSIQYFVVNSCLALSCFAAFYLLGKTVYWTID